MITPRPVALLASVVALAGCGASSVPSATRGPLPRPEVTLTASERAAWAPGPARRSAIPVLVYHGVAPAAAFAHREDADLAVDPPRFTKQMLLLQQAGYETITLSQFVRFLRGAPARLPPRPFVLTFDGRRDSWTGTDATLRDLGLNAVLFVDVGRVEAGDPEHLSWAQLRALQRSGRWEVQLESGSGKQLIRWGPRRDDVGPFYAYRGSEEVLGGWRERVFSDLAWGEDQLATRIPGYRPLAVAPPYGNFGQVATNDPRIPRLLRARLLDAFHVVFTQDRSPLARPRAGRVAGRLQITRNTTEHELRSRLAPR